MTIFNNRDHDDHDRASLVILKVVLLLLAVSSVANSFVIVPIHPKYPSSLVSKFPISTTTPLSTTFTLITTTESTMSPSRSNKISIRTFTSSRLFGGGFGGKTTSTTTSASGGGGSSSSGKGEDKKKKKEGMVKLKPKQQWDRYLSFKNEPKIRVAVRLVDDENDEWLEVGRVRTTMDQLTELAVARQRAIIAEVSPTAIPPSRKLGIQGRKIGGWFW
jgi:hypothetical protein